jgi:hypothetical protein
VRLRIGAGLAPGQLARKPEMAAPAGTSVPFCALSGPDVEDVNSCRA